VKILLDKTDFHHNYLPAERPDPDDLNIYRFSDQARAMVNAAGGGTFTWDGDDPYEQAVDPQEPGTEGRVFVFLGLQIDPEDCRGATAGLYNTSCVPKGIEVMLPEDVVQFRLRPALASRMHLDRCRLKWGEHKVYEAVPKEQGYTSAEVTDKSGKKHHVMLPGDHMRPRDVRRPAEGAWGCEKSPTNLCWYDDQTDPSWDECLFCGDPHERK